MAGIKKENHVERVKRERDGLDCLESIIAYAKSGFSSVDKNDLDVRLRWYGLYTQRPEEDGYFMLRVKIPNGTLSSLQLEALGHISREYAKNTGDVTTRQGIQFHNIRIDDVPVIFEQLAQVGLTTIGACGDISRNITGCPVAGIDASEFINAEPIVRKVHDHFLGNKEFSNLPRKFKMTISGCSSYCTGHEINDIGLIALRDGGDVVFDLWVGGGLGSKEKFAKRLGVHVRLEEVVEVCRHICAIFRDHGNRDSRMLARLKFLIADWGPGRFLAELETRLGRTLRRGKSPAVPTLTNRAHVGIYEQKQPGLVYVSAVTNAGLLSGDQMLAVSRLAADFGSGKIRLTRSQNLILLDVDKTRARALASRLSELRLPIQPSVFRTGTIACTGIQFCKLAQTETKNRAEDLISHLEDKFPMLSSPLRISVTGCPNSCAHYQICDIGFVGDFLNTSEGKIEAFRVYLGGHLGGGYSFGRKLKKKIPATEIKLYVESIVREFLETRKDESEGFQEYLARHTTEELERLGARVLEVAV
jgi:sulfite reductase beta subunit-like hemoprotein